MRTSGDHELFGVLAPAPGELGPSALGENAGPTSPDEARIVAKRSVIQELALLAAYELAGAVIEEIVSVHPS